MHHVMCTNFQNSYLSGYQCFPPKTMSRLYMGRASWASLDMVRRKAYSACSSADRGQIFASLNVGDNHETMWGFHKHLSNGETRTLPTPRTKDLAREDSAVKGGVAPSRRAVAVLPSEQPAPWKPTRESQTSPFCLTMIVEKTGTIRLRGAIVRQEARRAMGYCR